MAFARVEPEYVEVRLSRIPLVSAVDVMSGDQKVVYDRIVAGPRGAVVGPLRAALHSPELADRWQALGEFLRYRSILAPRVRELAIIVVGRFWNSELEWQIHAEAARSEGLDEETIEAIRLAHPPHFDYPTEALVYEYARQMVENGCVSDETYRRAHTTFDTIGVVELTALIGYYSMVCMTLNAHHITLPPVAGQQSRPSLDDGQLRPTSTTRLAKANARED